ncbi:hypothetical protein XAPC_898 [Xanthomonas citri pv. punicae str. LMG 859]|nr:hypothetical protein XAPC_898 [Xanthomonas citri pv. punicae str. LMG 859]
MCTEGGQRTGCAHQPVGIAGARNWHVPLVHRCACALFSGHLMAARCLLVAALGSLR